MKFMEDSRNPLRNPGRNPWESQNESQKESWKEFLEQPFRNPRKNHRGNLWRNSKKQSQMELLKNHRRKGGISYEIPEKFSRRISGARVIEVIPDGTSLGIIDKSLQFYKKLLEKRWNTYVENPQRISWRNLGKNSCGIPEGPPGGVPTCRQS